LWQIIIGPVLVGLLIAALTALGTSMLSHEAKPAAPRELPQSIGPLVVHNQRVAVESTGNAAQQTRASIPAVEVTLHNIGTRRAIFTGARFTVRGYGVLEPCHPLNAVPINISARYDVTLPLPPKVGQSVEIPISQQLGVDKADRVAFRFGSPEIYPASRAGFLYRLDVSLLYGRPRSALAVGTALVSLPATPSADELDGSDDPSDPARNAKCRRRNRSLLDTLSTGRVAISSDLAALRHELS
jgi:hypothetical protein